MMTEINMVPADIAPVDHGAAEDAQASGNRGVEMNQLLPFEEASPDKVVIETPVEVELAAHAAVIRVLGKRVVGDVIEIGRRLAECKVIAGHGGWLPWLDREFGWSERAAQNFISVHEASTKYANFADLDVPVSSLYLLAAPSTPPAARQAVIAAAADDRLTHEQVKEMVAKAKADAAADVQRQISEKRAEIERLKEQEILASYNGKLVLSPDQLAAEIAKTTDQLDADIEDKENEIKRLNRLLTKERREHEEQTTLPIAPIPKVKIDPEKSRESTAIIAAIIHLQSCLAITPKQLVEVEGMIAEATGQTLKERIGQFINAAKTIEKWFEKLHKEVGK